MKYVVCMLMVVVALTIPTATFGQLVKTAGAGTSEANRARLEELRAQGFEALYNLDYDSARRHFSEIARLFPDHPAGPQFLAAALWLRTLNQSRRLQSSLYNTEGFYAKTEDKVDPRTVQEFRELTRQAKMLAQARLKRDPRDVEALYFIGATEGIKAAFAGAVERRFIASIRGGSSSVDHHRDVIKLDPNFHDAELSIGMYDYVVGGLPLPFKILAGMTGVRGSKKRGLETLRRVAREGRWARDDAKTLLIALLKREKQFTEAFTLARELSEKYPRNYLFKLEAADALVSQAALERKANNSAALANTEREAFAVFESLLRDRSVRSLDLVHFRYGEALAVAGQPEAAAKEFLAAASVTGGEPGLATLARLRAAQSLDLAGKRNDALAQYRAVLARPNVYDAHGEAQRGMRQPYKNEE